MRSDEGVSRRADTLIRVHGKEMDHALLPQRLRPAAVVKTERMVGSNCDARPAKVGDGLIMVVSDPDIHEPRACISSGMATRRSRKRATLSEI